MYVILARDFNTGDKSNQVEELLSAFFPATIADPVPLFNRDAAQERPNVNGGSIAFIDNYNA